METELKNLERNVRAAIRKVVSDVREAEAVARKALVEAEKAAARPIPEAINGKTPVRGVDYLTDGEMSAFASLVLGRATPKKGRDYLTAAEVDEMVRRATPVKGRDYADGRDGTSLTWETLTEAQKDALRGPQGLQGHTPRHEWDGTKLRIEHAKGIWGNWHDLRGPKGDAADLKKALEKLRGDGFFARAGVGATRFSELYDVPPYEGNAGKALRINAAGDALEAYQPVDVAAVWGGITGNVADQADLVAYIAANSATPGGADAAVQFNDGGSLGGDAANLTWKNASDRKRLGVQVSDPQASFHAAAAVGTGIATPTGFANVQTAQTLPSAPTGSATVVTMPGAGSGGYLSFSNQGSGAFQANNTTYYFRVYPCVYDAATGTYYRSTAYEEISATDPNDSDYYDLSLSWGSVSVSGETVAYFVEGSTDGSSFSAIGTYEATSQTFNSLSGSDATTPWPTFYKAVAASGPDAPVSFDSATQQYDGSSSYYYASGQTILYEIDTYKDIGGTKYASGSPQALNGGSGFTDDSSGNYYYVDLYWTLAGSYDGVFLRKSTDGGSSWTYTDVGSTSSYSDYVFGDDGVTSGRWGQTYSPSATQDYTFQPYGIGTSPSGGAVYSAAGSEYTATVSDTYGVLIRHSLSGIPAGGAKVLADGEVGYSYGRVASAGFLDAGYTSWGAGPSVSPSSYGWSGSNQNAAYTVKALLTVSGTTIESVAAATLSVSNTGGVKANTLSWNAVSGATGYKITRSINGGTVQMVSVGSGTLSLEDDALRSWGSVTTYATAVIGVAGRFERDSASIGDAPILEAIAYGTGGTRYPKISLGYAAALGGTPTYYAHLVANTSTGYLDIASSRLLLKTSLGGSDHTEFIGGGLYLNKLASSTGHLNWRSQNDAACINTRADQDTVGFGQAIGADQQTTVQVQPARSGDAALVLIGHASMATTATLLRTQTSAGSFGADLSVAGAWRAGADSSSNPGHSWRADANTGFTNPTSDQIGVVTGGAERVRVDSGGNVGIGVTAVTSKLDVNQSSLAQVVLKYRSEATNDDPTVEVRQNRAATTDATQTTLHSFATVTNQSLLVEVTVLARRTGGSGGAAGDTAAYKVCGLFKNVSGTVTLVGAVTTLYSAESQAGWDCTLDVSGTTVRVRVTGAANNSVTWHLVEGKTSPLAS